MSEFHSSRKRFRYDYEGIEQERFKPPTHRKRFHHNVEVVEKLREEQDRTSKTGKEKPSYDKQRLQFKIDSFVEEASYFYRAGIEECLGAQAQIKDGQIRNRDEQIRMQLQGDLDERYDGETVMHIGQVDELNHHLSKTIDTLNWTIGNQAVAIEDKDKKISEFEKKVGELEKQVSELEQELASLRGQGLPFRLKE